MKTYNVKSSNLSEVKYDNQFARLYVTFQNGRVYMYENVPEDVVDELVTADSVGRYFNRLVKNEFSCTEIKDDGQ